MDAATYISMQNTLRAPGADFGINIVSLSPSTNGMANNLLVETGTGPVTAPTEGGRYNVLFVRDQDAYRILDDGTVEVQFNGGIDGALYRDFAYVIQRDETRFILEDDTAEVARLYQTAFGRVPDEPGLEFWLNAFKSGQASLAHIAENFIGSPEFSQNFGDFKSLPPEAFITLLYNNILDRDPDPAGYEFWVNAYKSGAQAEGIVIEFSNSQENKIKAQEWTVNTDNGQYIGPGFQLSPTQINQEIAELFKNHEFIDLTHLSFPDTQALDERGAQGYISYPLDFIEFKGLQANVNPTFVYLTTNNFLGGNVTDHRAVILPKEVDFVSPGTHNPNNDRPVSVNLDLIAPGSTDAGDFILWGTNSIADDVRFFLNDSHTDYITPLVEPDSVMNPGKFTPVEVHNFTVGQDIIEANQRQFRENDLDTFLKEPNLDPDEVFVAVLKNVDSNPDAIAAALSDYSYDEIGAILVQNGLDLDVYYLLNIFIADPLNKFVVHNELDGNNQIDPYEIALGLTLMNVEVNPGDPLIIDDVILPISNIYDTDNIQIDYLFL